MMQHLWAEPDDTGKSIRLHELAQNVQDSHERVMDLVYPTSSQSMFDAFPALHRGIEQVFKNCKLKKDLKRLGHTRMAERHHLPAYFEAFKAKFPAAAAFLEQSYADAFAHYGFAKGNPLFEGIEKPDSLECYLAAVGDHATRNKYTHNPERANKPGEPVPVLILHWEILGALLEYGLRGEDADSFEMRLHRIVYRAMGDPGGKSLAYGMSNPPTNEQLEREADVNQYLGWLDQVGRFAPAEQLRRVYNAGFTVPGCRPFVGESLRLAFDRLREHKDPAVRHYIRDLTLTRNVRPHTLFDTVEWLPREDASWREFTELAAPSGEKLGMFYRDHHGAYYGFIASSTAHNSPGNWRSGHQGVMAETPDDLINTWLERITYLACMIKGGGEERQVFLWGDHPTTMSAIRRIPACMELSEVELPKESSYTLNFWQPHGLAEGDTIQLAIDYVPNSYTGERPEIVYVSKPAKITAVKSDFRVECLTGDAFPAHLTSANDWRRYIEI